jgi:hypothetical protein
LAVDLSHIDVQRYVGGKWRAVESVEDEEGGRRVASVARALEHAVLLGMSDEIKVWYGKGTAQQQKAEDK